MRTVGRIIIVALSFVLAIAASLFVLFTLGLERVTQALHQKAGDPPEQLGDLISLMGETLALASAFTLLPALLVIIVGEVARVRSILFYLAGGGLALAAVPFMARLTATGDIVLPATTVWQVFATAGFMGGFVYWLLAGRNA